MDWFKLSLQLNKFPVNRARKMLDEIDNIPANQYPQYIETKKKEIENSIQYFYSSTVLTEKEKTDLEKLLNKKIDELNKKIYDIENEYMSTLPNGVEYDETKEGGRSRKRYKKRSSRRASRRKSRRASRRRKASRRRRK